MAPSGQEEEERTRAAVVMALHKARAIRGSITRYIQQFDKAASAFNRDTSSKRALELMENIASTITQKYSEVDECYIKVQTLVIDQEYMTNHEPTLQQELDRCNRVQGIMEKAQQEYIPTGEGSRFKVETSLKPEKITATASPSDHRQWLRAWMDFSQASRLDQAQEPIRIAHIRSCISQDFLSKLDSLHTFTATEQIIAAVQVEIERVNPLLVRRLQFNSAKQQPGQKYSDFLSDLKQLEISADVTSMNTQDFKLAVMLTGCKSDTLRLKLLEIPNLTCKKLSEKCLEIEAQALINKSMGAAPTREAANLASAPQRGRGRGRGRSRGRGRGQGRGARGSAASAATTARPRELAGVTCYICMQKGHYSRRCNADRATISCQKCSSMGQHATGSPYCSTADTANEVAMTPTPSQGCNTPARL